jgi:hypothetical protein
VPASVGLHLDGSLVELDDYLSASQKETPAQQGKHVTVTGVGLVAEKPNTFIITGSTQNPITGDTSPVAVRVDDKSMVLQRRGQQVPAAAVLQLQEGAEIVVDGKKGKNGSLRAARMVL